MNSSRSARALVLLWLVEERVSKSSCKARPFNSTHPVVTSAADTIDNNKCYSIARL